jgi:hypothetical protein
MKRQSALSRGLSGLVLAATMVFASLPAHAETVLVMVEEAGCIWCARWNKEIGPIYPKTPEGMAAPLRRIDIHAPLPDDISVKSRLTFTPTFVLLENGIEIARIEGYPGEDFFWGLLGQMLKEVAPNNDRSG